MAKGEALCSRAMEGVPRGESKKPKGVKENETELISVNDFVL
jgi:hypothetical protein